MATLPCPDLCVKGDNRCECRQCASRKDAALVQRFKAEGVDVIAQNRAEEKRKARNLRAKEARKARGDAMRSVGMVKARGALGGNYWE